MICEVASLTVLCKCNYVLKASSRGRFCGLRFSFPGVCDLDFGKNNFAKVISYFRLYKTDSITYARKRKSQTKIAHVNWPEELCSYGKETYTIYS